MPEWYGTCLQEFGWEAETIKPNAYPLSCGGWGFVAHICCLIPWEQFFTNAFVCTCSKEATT